MMHREDRALVKGVGKCWVEFKKLFLNFCIVHTRVEMCFFSFKGGLTQRWVVGSVGCNIILDVSF